MEQEILVPLEKAVPLPEWATDMKSCTTVINEVSQTEFTYRQEEPRYAIREPENTPSSFVQKSMLYDREDEAETEYTNESDADKPTLSEDSNLIRN